MGKVKDHPPHVPGSGEADLIDKAARVPDLFHVGKALQQDGVRILCCGEDLKVGKDADGIRFQAQSHGQGYDLEVDQILVAAGRTPNVQDLGLEAAGIRLLGYA